MSVALRLYEQLTEAGEDKTRAKLIAEALEQLEDRYPHLKDTATQSQLRETELRLQKEIKEVEARLQKDIAGIDLKIKEVEARLTHDIRDIELQLKDIDLKIKDVELKLQQAEIRLMGAIHRQTYWIIGSIGTIIGFIRFLDWLLAHVPK